MWLNLGGIETSTIIVKIKFIKKHWMVIEVLFDRHISFFRRGFIAILLLVIYANSISAQDYSIILGRPTDTSMTANIMFDLSGQFYLKWGTQSGTYIDSTALLTYTARVPYVVDMNNLTADTKYYYCVAYKNNGSANFTISPEYTYHTQRLPGSSFTFTVEADEHLYDYGNQHLYQVSLANVALDNPDFMFTLGDIFGDDHYPFTITSQQVDSLRRAYRQRLGAVCNSIPFNICLGNHDGEKMYYLDTLAPNNLAIWSTLWRKYYYSNPEPNGFYSGNSNAEGFGIGLPEDYYSFTWGNALFVVLDAYRFDCDSVTSLQAKPKGWNWTLGLAQYNWLKNTLQNSTAKFKFVFVHHPLGEERGGIIPAQLFEWGGHEQNGTYTFDTHRPGWGVPIQQLFVNYGVNILFQGHDHLFAHEVLDSITYQEVPMMADSTYVKGSVNTAAYTADTLQNSGYVRVTVSASCVKVDYIKSYLPRDTVTGINHNHSVAFSYTIGTCDSAAFVSNLSKNINLNVFPNPATNLVNISFDDNSHVHLIRLINTVGGEISQTQEDHIDVSSIPTGLYFLNIRTENYQTVRKILVIH